jgi:hypothetical protein
MPNGLAVDTDGTDVFGGESRLREGLENRAAHGIGKGVACKCLSMELIFSGLLQGHQHGDELAIERARSEVIETNQRFDLTQGDLLTDREDGDVYRIHAGTGHHPSDT